jgi:tRNA(fMet)-specific endonuclease VapC
VRYLIDANSVIYLAVNAFPNLSQRIAETEQGEIGLSAIVFAELVLGANQGKPPPVGALNGLIEEMPLLPFDEAAARAYGQLPFKRARFDRLLAGHALSLGLVLITTNVRDFSDVPELKLEDWTQ